jgi:hypothetical protein
MFEKMIVLYDIHKDNGMSPIHQMAKRTSHATLIEIMDRPTFADFFSVANQFPGKNILVCNSDIYYDDSLSLIKDCHLDGAMMALTRWTPAGDGAYSEFQWPDGTWKHTASADTWIFKSPLPVFRSDFRLGVGNCDAMLAGEATRAGLRITNPSKSIKSYHLHSPGFLNDERNKEYPGGPETPITELGEK